MRLVVDRRPPGRKRLATKAAPAALTFRSRSARRAEALSFPKYGTSSGSPKDFLLSKERPRGRAASRTCPGIGDVAIYFPSVFRTCFASCWYWNGACFVIFVCLFQSRHAPPERMPARRICVFVFSISYMADVTALQAVVQGNAKSKDRNQLERSRGKRRGRKGKRAGDGQWVPACEEHRIGSIST